MRSLAFVMAILVATTALADAMPYDETRDAKADVRQALAQARANHRPVLMIFGANWCPDCRALDKALSTGRNAALLHREFNVVKVDVGRFDRNLDLVTAYGHPTKKGIPAAVVLSAENEVLYATRAGELADARHMSETGIYDFFEAVTRTAKKTP